MFESPPVPFYYMVPTEENGATSFEIRYALDASSLMTVGLESGGPHEDSVKLSEEAADGDTDSIDEPSQEDVVVIEDDTDDDDVVFVSCHKETEKEVKIPTPEPNKKPFNVVKPFTASNDIGKFVLGEEVVVIDDDAEDEYYKKVYDRLEKEYEDENSSSDNFEIHDLCEKAPSPQSTPEKLDVNVGRISERTIDNYSSRRKWKIISSSDDSDDPTYNPYEPSTTGGKERKRKSSSDDSTYVPSGPTKDMSVYQIRPLDKLSRNNSRITFCERVIDFVGCQKLPKVATELCTGYWDGLNLRTKRKCLPRSKYALCTYGVDDPQIQDFMTAL